MYKFEVILASGLVAFLVGLFALCYQSNTLKHECNIKAMENKYSSAEIQTICHY